MESYEKFIDKVEDALSLADEKKELNIFLSLEKEKIRSSAEKITDAMKSGTAGMLAGKTVAIKDAIITKGTVTTAGSQILKDFVPPYDATVIERLIASDALLFGKTNMDEFAMGSSNENSSFGPVRNPLNPEYVPGGSSGG